MSSNHLKFSLSRLLPICLSFLDILIMHSKLALISLLGATVSSQQLVQEVAPPVQILSTTKSGVLPSLPTATPFTGLRTLQGAVVDKAPADPSYQGLNGPAQVQSNLPTGTYVATLPSVMYNPGIGATISGSISGAASSNGTGVMFRVDFSGFPSLADYGPFVYHIHDKPVPSDGNCTETLAHLDPTNRGEYIPCTASNPSSCQAGDLAGKHGKIEAISFTANYVDMYLSTDPASAYFFGDKSIVLHTRNTTRLICANFVLAGGSGNATGGNGPSGIQGTSTSTTFGSSASRVTATFAGALCVALLAFTL